MNILKFFIIATCVGHALYCSSEATKFITITLDDLPFQQADAPSSHQAECNHAILTALENFNAPAIGFVNESKLYVNQEHEPQSERVAILQNWVDRGFDLGNHTFSHCAFSSTPLETFKDNVIKGAEISRSIMENAGKSYKYFRHPYLDTGLEPEPKKEFEKFLQENSYTISPVTIDTDDWMFNQHLLEHPDQQNEIVDYYIKHTLTKFAFYEQVEQAMFGRSINHIWLLHANLLNSLAMERLLEAVQKLGYKFITHEQALEDPAHLSVDTYFKPFGVSWLTRWDFSRETKSINWEQEPEPDFKNLHE